MGELAQGEELRIDSLTIYCETLIPIGRQLDCGSPAFMFLRLTCATSIPKRLKSKPKIGPDD